MSSPSSPTPLLFPSDFVIPTGVNWPGRATVANGACGGEFLRGGIAMGASRISGHELQRASRGIQAGIAKGTNAACERELQRVPRGHVGTNSQRRQRSTQAGIAMDANVASRHELQRT